MHELQSLFNSLWVAWFFVLFGGILVWVLWPTRKKTWEERGKMILRDEDPGKKG